MSVLELSEGSEVSVPKSIEIQEVFQWRKTLQAPKP